MKISKSKRQLAQLLIEAGVTQFPEGANWAAQCIKSEVSFRGDKPTKEPGCEWVGHCCLGSREDVATSRKIPNWHQTALSRDEFDQIVAETVVPSEPSAEIRWVRGDDIHATPTSHDCMVMLKSKGDLVTCECKECNRFYNREGDSAATTSTLDQLLQDWRNADDYAQRKQTEADEAAAMRDERWQAVQARAGEMGVTVGRCEPVVTEPEVVITDWWDLQVGDRIWVGDSGHRSNCPEGEYDIVDRVHSCESQPVGVMWNDRVVWPYIHDRGWRFIRRP